MKNKSQTEKKRRRIRGGGSSWFEENDGERQPTGKIKVDARFSSKKGGEPRFGSVFASRKLRQRV